MKFADDFTCSLIDKIPTQYLETIREELTIFSKDYEIKELQTKVVPYTYNIPGEVVKYLAVRKIEGASDKTIASYQLQLTNFFKALGKAVIDVTSDDILLYLANYRSKRKVSDATLELYRTIIHSFFEWCVVEEILSKNPCRKVKPIKYNRQPEATLTDFQVEKLRSNCKYARDKAIIDFFISTGCRVSELVSVNYEDIDFSNNKLDIIGKGNKTRTIYLNGKCIYSLSEYLKERGTGVGPLFTQIRGNNLRLTKGAVERMLDRLGKDSNISNIHPHLFRKTMATNAVRSGMDVTMAQKILGHSNISTTMIYVNIDQTAIADAHKKYC